jgi:hypothetical protein
MATIQAEHQFRPHGRLPAMDEYLLNVVRKRRSGEWVV